VSLTLDLKIIGTALIHKVNLPVENHKAQHQVLALSDSFDSIKSPSKNLQR
jgi:hypothetical protein